MNQYRTKIPTLPKYFPGKRKWGFILLLIIPLSILLITTPSYGLSLNSFIKSITNSIKSEIQGERQRIKTMVKNNINVLWAAVQEDANKAINASTGAMGEPDPIGSSDDLFNAIANKYSRSVAAEKSLALQRALTKASISAVMGVEGQQFTAKKIDETTNTTNDASDLAQQAQEMNASQNILKVIAAQNGQIVSMLGQQRTDSLESRLDVAGSNLMLVQMNEQLASKQKKEEIRDDAIVSLNHELLGMSVLDPAYTGEK